MQRKQQVGECWVCVIFFSQLDLVSVLRRVCRGVTGGWDLPYNTLFSPMIVIMLNNSYDYVSESCNHVLINENTRQLTEEGKILESTSHDITCGIDETYR
jgi:hypothetical protein